MRLWLTLAAVGVLSGSAAAKPNVLFVVADDQRFDTIRALGNLDVRTPTLDALVARGTAFTNAYNQGSLVPAVCTPSRTMLLTGRSLFRIPNPAAKTYSGPTLGGTFAAAGYHTGCVSKPGNSFRFGHEAFGKVVHIPHVGAETNAKCADAAIDFLSNAPADKPFFLYLAPSMPHDPRTAEPRFHAEYDPDKLTLSKNFLPRHPFDIGVADIRDEQLAPVPRPEADMRRHLAEYYACVTSLDFHLGRVLDAVKAANRLDDTLVVFTSDSGLAVGGRHGLMGKQNLYEHVKPPLVVAGPGVPAGKSDALVYLFDLFPTVCELTKTPVPAGLEGKSLAGVIVGRERAVRDELFAAYAGGQRMLRDGRWKLLWYPLAGRTQLFDLSADPDEVADLSAKPEHAARVADLTKRLAAAQAAWADTAAQPAGRPPGVTVAFSPAASRQYVGSPGLAVLPSGEYVASHDLFGPGSTRDVTRVYASADKGGTWAKRAEIKGQWWSSLFAHRDALYLMGTSKEYGHCVVRRSTDGGRTWTEPTDAANGLLLAGTYHCAPVPVVEHDGRLWRAMERYAGPVWGGFEAFVMSAPLDADLLNAASWTSTNRLAGDPAWLGETFGGWLEGNVVVTPTGGLVNVLRIAQPNYPEKAAVARVSADGKTLSFDPAADVIDFPGGGKKFTIRYDAVSKRYWSLVNVVPDELRGPRPDRRRNVLALAHSADLKTWTVGRTVVSHPDVERHAFQYPDWRFDGDDMIALVRTAFAEPDGTPAHNAHDANHLTFHRVSGFRK